MRSFWDKIRGKKKHAQAGDKSDGFKQDLHVEISTVRFVLRNKFLSIQKSYMRDQIISKLSYLKDEVNVEAILADLGEKYVMRRDLNDVVIDTNVNSDPVLILRFTKESASEKIQTDRLVPLEKYALES